MSILGKYLDCPYLRKKKKVSHDDELNTVVYTVQNPQLNYQ